MVCFTFRYNIGSESDRVKWHCRLKIHNWVAVRQSRAIFAFVHIIFFRSNIQIVCVWPNGCGGSECRRQSSAYCVVHGMKKYCIDGQRKKLFRKYLHDAKHTVNGHWSLKNFNCSKFNYFLFFSTLWLTFLTFFFHSRRNAEKRPKENNN